MSDGAGEEMSWQTVKAKAQQYRRAIWRSFALIGVSLAAIVAYQLPVDPPPLPVVACGVNQWVTTTAYTSTIAGVVTVIPAGFTNDMASIPDITGGLLAIDRFHPAIRRGALTHDLRYRHHIGTREFSDWLLWQACLEDGMDEAKARAVYLWVREWGFIAWEKSQR